MINEALKSKNDTDPPKYILKNNCKIDDPSAMAEVFNDFFVNIGPNLANTIPKSNLEFQNFLKAPNPQSLFFTPVLEIGIKTIITNLNTKKGSGYDGITNFLLKISLMK